VEMEASGGPWAADRPYIMGPSVATGGRASRSIRRGLRRPNGLASSTDLLPNGSFRPNGYLAVTASSVRESAFADLRVMFRLTWTRYALL
jgi:hypothetical protein